MGDCEMGNLTIKGSFENKGCIQKKRIYQF